MREFTSRGRRESQFDFLGGKDTFADLTLVAGHLHTDDSGYCLRQGDAVRTACEAVSSLCERHRVFLHKLDGPGYCSTPRRYGPAHRS